MRNGILLSVFVGVIALCNAARAEIFEVPLPITGTYQLNERRDFSVDFGTGFSEIREAWLRLEGTMVAPLRGPFGDPTPTIPHDGLFQVFLTEPRLVATGPSVGRDTYPSPEPFGGQFPFESFEPIDWSPLLDGRTAGWTTMTHSGVVGNQIVAGGTGTITSASLILDATVIPEPTLAVGVGLGVWLCGLSSRRRRRRHSAA
jgi:hypothetical protein